MFNTILNHFLCGTLGVLFQICVVKIPRLRAASLNANRPFSFKEYISDDWPAIMGSFIAVGILCFCLDELLNIKPDLAKIVKWLFVFVGFTGSSIIQAILSVTNKKIMELIDVKTNISDSVVPDINDKVVKDIKEQDSKLSNIKTAAPSDNGLNP